MRVCAAGILFGLKVVLMASDNRWQYVTLPYIGIPVSLPPKAVAWAELLVIKYMVPQSSLTGHLCGLLAGVRAAASVWNGTCVSCGALSVNYDFLMFFSWLFLLWHCFWSREEEEE